MSQRGDDNKINVRLEDGMRDQLKTDAKANGRTLNAEVVARLSGSQISLRDWFAGQALAGELAAEDMGVGAVLLRSKENAELMAARAYHMADAMLAERRKGGA